MKPKEARCRFNKNRKVYQHYVPYCSWGEEVMKKMPPHLFLQTYQEVNCTPCRCFEEADE